MTSYRIICKRKRAQFERIESIGCIDTTTGAEMRFTEDQAIELIESGAAHFIVRDAEGHEAEVEVEQREGRKFLITRRDRVVTDNLLWLPECQPQPIPTPPTPRPVTPPRVHGFGPSPNDPRRY
jgi:hypothetical protein